MIASNDYLIIILVLIIVPAYIYNRYYKNRQKKQLKYIKNYQFPQTIKTKLKELYPHLSEEELNKVFFALRDYFFIANRAYGKTVAMPSKIVDIAWHEFILFTKDYQIFCKHAFGKFLHHTPTESISKISTKNTIDKSLQRTWKYACFKENILPSSPDKLPLLFAIDKLLKIEDGNIYTLGNNLTNILASHRYGCSGAACGGGTTTGCSGSSCGGGCGGS